jgi:hypothetical protein
MPKICEFENCRGFANYGQFYGKPIRCNVHKEEYKLVSQLCQEDNCKIFACFNFENEVKPKFCNEHKKSNMIDIKNRSKNCKYLNCNIRALYNFEGETNGLYCSQHKIDGMIDMHNKKCKYPNCKIQSIFNCEGETKALYCGQHKIDGMIDVKNKKCKYANCKKQPIFNYESETHSIYCNEHKIDGMININSKKCQYDNCKKIPTFNFENEKNALYCSEHKKDGMVNITSKKCGYSNCKKIPTFNFENEKNALYCFEHKLENMIDINHLKCKAGFCLGSRGNPKYKGYCSSCYQHLFPNDPLTFQIRSKTKEIAVRDFINANFEGFQHDTPLWTGNCDCTHRRRIDHRKLIGNTLLCIETDENQHKNYDEKDEEIRYDDLFMLHGGKFIYIRFNPDKFKNKDGKSLNPMLYTRLPILKQEIEKQIERIKNEENIEILEIIKLYYNE